MGHNDDPIRRLSDAERERRRQERKEKWEKREKGFWRAFLFTEDGRPKSGLLVYTFCLSLAYVLLYIAGFNLAIERLSPVTAAWPAFAGNLLQSLAVGGAMALVSLALHRLFSDKRLVLGCHLWLAFYGLLVCVSMAFMLGDWEAFAVFLHFFMWFMLLPAAVGLAVSFLLYRRDCAPPEEDGDEPWKKYTRRR